MDTEFVRAYEQGDDRTTCGKGHERDTPEFEDLQAIRQKHRGFMAGTTITYEQNLLVSNVDLTNLSTLATNIKVGMRFPPPKLVGHSAAYKDITKGLRSDGRWRLLVFPGNAPSEYATQYLKQIEDLFSRTSPRSLINRYVPVPWQANLVFRVTVIPASRTKLLGFSGTPTKSDASVKDRSGECRTLSSVVSLYDEGVGDLYRGYGIDSEHGAIFICRPDQHVGWLGELHDTEAVEDYFSRVFTGRC
jgi:phenol 2-monooxygenase